MNGWSPCTMFPSSYSHSHSHPYSSPSPPTCTIKRAYTRLLYSHISPALFPPQSLPSYYPQTLYIKPDGDPTRSSFRAACPLNHPKQILQISRRTARLQMSHLLPRRRKVRISRNRHPRHHCPRKRGLPERPNQYPRRSHPSTYSGGHRSRESLSILLRHLALKTRHSWTYPNTNPPIHRSAIRA